VNACPRCGAALAPGASHCAACGASSTADTAVLATPSTPRTIAATETMVGRACPYCRFPIKQGPGVTECSSCHAVHHAECFADNRGCAIAGCSGANVLGAAAAPLAVPPPPPAAQFGAPTVAANTPSVPTMAAPPPPPLSAPPAGSSGAWWKPALIAFAITVAVAGAAVAVILGTKKSPHTTTVVRTAQPSAETTAPADSGSADSAGSTDTTGVTDTTGSGDTSGSSDTSSNSSSDTGSSDSSGSASSGADSTPNGSPATAASAVAGPDKVFRWHLQALNEGNAQKAFNYFVPSYRASNPDWVSNREQASPTIRIVSIGPVHRTASDSADVDVDFFAQDANPTSGSDTKCREFTGSVHMEKVGSVWRYAPALSHLQSATQDSSECG